MPKAPTHGDDHRPPSAPPPAATLARDDAAPADSGVNALLVEAQALKELLREGHERAGRLRAALKRHARQAHLLRSALASLRQLQGLGG